MSWRCWGWPLQAQQNWTGNPAMNCSPRLGSRKPKEGEVCKLHILSSFLRDFAYGVLRHPTAAQEHQREGALGVPPICRKNGVLVLALNASPIRSTQRESHTFCSFLRDHTARIPLGTKALQLSQSEGRLRAQSLQSRISNSKQL